MNFHLITRVLFFLILSAFGFIALGVSLTLITVPPQSLVYVNGMLVGQTNQDGILRIKVESVSKIKVENIGYLPSTFFYSPTSKSATLLVNLKPIAYLSLNSSPKGAKVVIDGEEEVITPATVEIASGQHSLDVSKNGYAPEHLTINVKPFSVSSKEFTLKKLGRITIKSVPDHVSVDLNDELVGVTPFSTILSRGTYFLTVGATGYSRISTSLIVTENSTFISKWFRLKKLATISVSSSPSGARISMAGTTFTAPSTITVEIGKYSYTASQTYSYPATGELNISGNGKYTVKLKRIEGLVVFSSNPVGAAVKLDGKLVGQTQLSIQVPYGVHFVKMVGPDGKVWFGRVKIDQKVTTVYGDMVNTGMVLVNANPATGTIAHIGQIWTSVPATLSAGVGVYRVEVFNPNYPAITRYIKITGGRVSKLSFSLESKAKLFVLSKPLGAMVFVDGKELGHTPIFDASVPIGDQLLTIKWQDGNVQKHFLFEKDKVYALSFSDPHSVKITFLSFPDPVKLFIDGKDEGYTPCAIILSRGKHSYEIYNVMGMKIAKGELCTTAFSSKTYFFLSGR